MKRLVILLAFLTLVLGHPTRSFASTIFNDTFNPNSTPEDLEVYDSNYEPFTINGSNEISTYSNKAIVTGVSGNYFYIKTDLSILGQKSLATSFTPSSTSAVSSNLWLGWDADPGIITDSTLNHSGGYMAIFNWNYEKLTEVDIYKLSTTGGAGTALVVNASITDDFNTSTYIIQMSNDPDGNIIISVNGTPEASVHDTDFNTGYFFFSEVQGTMNSLAITDYTSAEIPILCQPLDILCNLKTLLVPTSSSFTSSYSTLQTAFNTHAPFAYIGVISSLDFSATATATSTPTLNLPMASTATISAPYHIAPGTTAITWNDPGGSLRKFGTYTKPIFTIGLWLLLILVVINITHKMLT